MTSLRMSVAAAALALSAPAAAQDAPARDSGLQVAGRLAFGLPFGQVSDDVGGQDLGDVFDSMVPLWLEANYRLNRELAIGIYGQYGFMQTVAEELDASNWRLGAQATWRLAPLGRVVPWVGAGLGWEWVNFDTPDDDGLNGYDLMLQGGADFGLGEGVNLGPFVAVTFGRFLDATSNRGDVEIDDTTFHGWLQFGLRGTFDL